MSNYSVLKENENLINDLIDRGIISTSIFAYYSMYEEFKNGSSKMDIAIRWQVTTRTVDRAILFMRK